MDIRTIILFVSLLSSFSVQAGELTFTKAVELALKHAPAMQAAEAGRDAASEDRQIGLARLYPSLSASGSYRHSHQRTDYLGNQNVFQSEVRGREKSGVLRITQPVVDLERVAGYEHGIISAESGELRLRLEHQQIVLEVAKNFLGCMIAEAAVKSARAREQAAEELVGQAQAAFDLGLAPINDKLDSEVRRDMTKTDYLSASNQLGQVRTALSSLIGKPVEQMQFPSLSEDIKPLQHDLLPVWENLAANHSIPVLLSEKQLQAAKVGVEQAEGATYPKVEIFAELGYTYSSSTSVGPASKYRNGAVGVQVSVPIYAGGGQAAQIRKSTKESVQVGFKLQDEIRTARLSAQQSFLAYSSAISRLRAMENALVSSIEAAKAAHMGLKVGLRSMVEVLDADERRFNTEKALIEAKAQVIFAELQMLASIGKLDQIALFNQFGREVQRVVQP